MCSVQGGADEFGETCVYNGELLDCSLFYIQNLGDKTSALCHYGAAQLKVELLSGTQFEFVAEDIKVFPEVWNGILLRVDIINTQAAAYIDAVEFDSLFFQHILQVICLLAEQTERLHVKDL